MRSPLQTSLRPSSRPHSSVAPYKGWNTASPQASLNEAFALFLDNFYPVAGGVELRKGSRLQATHTDSARNFRSLMHYSPVSGTDKLFAGAEDGIYDVTAGGTVSAPVTAGTANTWQGVNITTAGGNFLWCCNATDKCRVYNGSTWTLLDGSSTPALSGVDTLKVQQATLFKRRLFMFERNSLSFWYLGVNSIGGTAVEFPVGALCSRGGYIVAIDSWTYEASNGPGDFFAIFTSEGQAVVYQGSDPASAADWALVGVYDVGTPLGLTPTTKVNGDLCILTVNGVLSMSRIIKDAGIAAASISGNIDPTLQAYALDNGAEFGWGLQYFAAQSMLIVNVPVGLKRSWQVVLNARTGAWCRFTGMDAEAWTVGGTSLYFAHTTKVCEGWTGTDDRGAAIIAKVQQAPTYFKAAGGRHFVSLVRVNANVAGSFPLQLGLARDFSAGSYSGSLTTMTQNVALWDTAIWDSAVWAEDGASSSIWRSVAHFPGHVISFKMRLSAKGVAFTWYSTDYILRSGGML